MPSIPTSRSIPARALQRGVIGGLGGALGGTGSCRGGRNRAVSFSSGRRAPRMNPSPSEVPRAHWPSLPYPGDLMVLEDHSSLSLVC